MADLGECPDCGLDLSDKDLGELPYGGHGKACPDCGTDVFCGECGDLTMPVADPKA
jgi:hypothetical protein